MNPYIIQPSTHVISEVFLGGFSWVWLWQSMKAVFFSSVNSVIIEFWTRPDIRILFSGAKHPLKLVSCLVYCVGVFD